MPASPTNPCDSQLYKLQQEGTSKQDQHIDHLRNSKIWAEADTDYRYLRNSKIWAEADTAGARSDANIKTVINLRSDFDNQDTEKTPIVPKTVTDKGVKSLAPRPETKIPKINQTCEDRVSETLNRNHLKSQDDVVPFIYNVVYGQGLIVTVNLKDECLIRFVEDRSLPPFRSKQVFEQLTQSCRVKLQGGKYIAHQPDNRISVIPERNHLTCDLKIQFDVSFIDNVVYWQRLIVTINLKDECLIRLVENRSLPPFRSKQVFEQLTQSCRVNNGDTNIGADEVSHVVKKTYGERNNKDGCPVELEEVRSLNRTCIRFYVNTFFEQLMKSCRGVLKGIDVKCFLLVMVFIHLAVASPLERVCLVSNDLVVTPSGPLQVGKRMKLICRHNCYQGTPRWDQDRPIGSKLTFNGDVLPPHKQTIDLEINENEYNIIFPNVTFTDINSTYSCHYSFVLTQISPIEYYKVLPTIESISKQSVYENNVLNGTLEFKEVYPLPECVLYCDDKRQKEIPICETCKTWERDFFKVKFTFNIDLNNKNCREENVSVRCAVGRENYKYDFSKLPKNKENNEATAGISVGVIIGVLVGFAVLGTILYKLYKHGAFRRCQRGNTFVSIHL
ncbi:uncharacterized protein LOC127701867 [Mytilus californianus]|uniref:uncharacterized protein LOC127701867 n=1 Tax=Mytilus californianus TaxID=6549 RepID=UPI0022486B08|nr:uncharacterized protein LOC127701867 [Mytilus californianus]